MIAPAPALGHGLRPIGHSPQQILTALAAALLALALLLAARGTPLWERLQWRGFDLLTTWAAPGLVRTPSAIVAIDEPSFQQLGQAWPFPRSWHARLINRLREDGAAAIAFDVVFADPSADAAEDEALAQSIAAAVAAGIPVVLASAQEVIDSAQARLWTDVLPLPTLLAAGALAGDAGVQPEDDFVVRRQSQGAGRFAAVLAQAMGQRPTAGASDAPRLLAYRGPRGTFDTRSYYQALEHGLLPPGFFRGKVVLVGRSSRMASDLQHSQADMFNTPLTTPGGDRLFPGVELQATAWDNLMQGDGLRALPEGWSAAFVVLALAVIVPASVYAHPGVTAGLAGALLMAALGLWAGLFAQGLWWPALLATASVPAIYAATAAVSYARVRRRAQQTRAMFAQYVPPEVVARLVEQPERLRLGGEVREVTLLFTDLAGFTSVSEHLSAEETVALLTEYFGTMTPLIHAQGGTVDKFIGDAIMAFWGAPLADSAHAEHALRAAIAMQEAMAALASRLQARGLPSVAMRIGVHSGAVVVGNVGSAQRFSYTAIGDAVNLASRLEGANKAFGSAILVSDATVAQLPADLAAGLRALDDIIVKGKTQPVRVYTPCSDAALRALSEQALAAFAQRQWESAEQALHDLLQRQPGDKAALALLSRIAAARDLPPDAAFSSAVALDKL